MNKTSLLMIAVFFTITAMGQTQNEKKQFTGFQNQLNSENLQSYLGPGEKPDSTISEVWDEDAGNWIFSSRKKYSYTINDNTTTAIGSEKNAGTGFAWEYTDKTETTVDANGNTTLEITFSWDKTLSQWEAGMKMEFTFNANEDMTSNSTYMWNSSLDMWFGLIKTEYTLDDNSNVISDIGYRWDFLTSGWLESGKTEYTYTNGDMTQELSYDWDNALSEWVSSGKTELTYTEGNISMDISSDWNTTTSEWINANKNEYTYTDGKMTMEISYDWDEIADDWVYSSKIDITFDANGEMVMYSFYSWDKTASVWIGEMKIAISSGVVSNGINYSISTSYSWDENTSDWIYTGKSTSYYSDQTSNFNEFSNNEVLVYPNPANDFIQFDFPYQQEPAFLQIFDIQGKLILERKLTNQNPIPVSSLHKGVYIYKLQMKGMISKGKLLIE